MLVYYVTERVTAVESTIVHAPGRQAFKHSLMFADKARSTQVEQFSGGPLWGRLLALLTNIRLGQKSQGETL
jgi:hypothetical protein